LIQATPDLRLLWAPSETYRALAAPDGMRAGVPLATIARVCLPAVVAGISTAVTATGRITWGLALSAAACWMLLPVLQLVTSLAIVVPFRRRVGIARAIDLFFRGHAAWSLWLLGGAALLFAAPATVPQSIVLYSGLVPYAWTAIVTFAFCRQVLGLDPRGAAVRTAIHLALTGVAILLYVAWAVALWPRIIATELP
jgi:hypothetical protein